MGSKNAFPVRERVQVSGALLAILRGRVGELFFDERHHVADGANFFEGVLVDLFAQHLLQVDDQIDGVETRQIERLKRALGRDLRFVEVVEVDHQLAHLFKNFRTAHFGLPFIERRSHDEQQGRPQTAAHKAFSR